MPRVRTRLLDRRYIPHTIVAMAAAAIIVALLAPSEQRLGETVKLIYLHASVTWVALCAFLAAAIAGLVALVGRSDRWAAWSVATLATATLFWSFHFVLGLITMRLAWGAWFWSEPRIRAGLLILGASIAGTLLAIAVQRRWAGPAISVGMAAFVLVLLSSAGRVFHPTSAIRDSSSLAIKGAVGLIVLLVAATSVQITRLFLPVSDATQRSQ